MERGYSTEQKPKVNKDDSFPRTKKQAIATIAIVSLFLVPIGIGLLAGIFASCIKFIEICYRWIS